MVSIMWLREQTRGGGEQTLGGRGRGEWYGKSMNLVCTEPCRALEILISERMCRYDVFLSVFFSLLIKCAWMHKCMNFFGTNMLVGYFFFQNHLLSPSKVKWPTTKINLFQSIFLGSHRAYWCWWTCWAQRDNGRFLKCFPSEVEWPTSNAI